MGTATSGEDGPRASAGVPFFSGQVLGARVIMVSGGPGGTFAPATDAVRGALRNLGAKDGLLDAQDDLGKGPVLLYCAQDAGPHVAGGLPR